MSVCTWMIEVVCIHTSLLTVYVCVCVCVCVCARVRLMYLL